MEEGESPPPAAAATLPGAVPQKKRKNTVTTEVMLKGTAREVYEEEHNIQESKTKRLREKHRKKVKKRAKKAKKSADAKEKQEQEPLRLRSGESGNLSDASFKHRTGSMLEEVTDFRKNKTAGAKRRLWKKAAEIIELENMKKNNGHLSVDQVVKVKQGPRIPDWDPQEAISLLQSLMVVKGAQGKKRKRRKTPRSSFARVGNIVKRKSAVKTRIKTWKNAKRHSLAASHAAAGSANSVMLSYCRRNSKVVHDLHALFMTNRRKVWVDWTSIPKSVDWWESIKSGINSANTCVVCLSDEFIKSKVCGDEIEHMLSHKKRIIPIVVADDFNWDDVHPELAKLNFIFFTPLPPEDDADAYHHHMQQMYEELIDAIDTDYAYLELHSRFTEWAVEWEKHGRDAGVLLQGNYLNVVDEFLETSTCIETPQPSTLMLEFFQKSKARSLREREKEALLEQLIQDKRESMVTKEDLLSYDELAKRSCCSADRDDVESALSADGYRKMFAALIVVDAALSATFMFSDVEKDSAEASVFWALSLALLLAFLVELCAQWFVRGSGAAKNVWCLLDSAIVVTSLAIELTQGKDWIGLDVFKSLRIARIFRVALMNEEASNRALRLEVLDHRFELLRLQKLIASIGKSLTTAAAGEEDAADDEKRGSENEFKKRIAESTRRQTRALKKQTSGNAPPPSLGAISEDEDDDSDGEEEEDEDEDGDSKRGLKASTTREGTTAIAEDLADMRKRQKCSLRGALKVLFAIYALQLILDGAYLMCFLPPGSISFADKLTFSASPELRWIFGSMETESLVCASGVLLVVWGAWLAAHFAFSKDSSGSAWIRAGLFASLMLVLAWSIAVEHQASSASVVPSGMWHNCTRIQCCGLPDGNSTKNATAAECIPFDAFWNAGKADICASLSCAGDFDEAVAMWLEGVYGAPFAVACLLTACTLLSLVVSWLVAQGEKRKQRRKVGPAYY